MANYFSKYPTTYYALDEGESGLNTVTYLTNRIGFDQKVLNNAALYSNYFIKDGDTPENLAHKLYGDSEKHWIILMANRIIDPQFDWPMDSRTLIKFIEDKYVSRANTGQTGFEWANQNTESYYRVETKVISSNGLEVDDVYQIDADTYATLNTSNESYTKTLEDGEVLTVTVRKTRRTYLEYEEQVNESKRTIKILDKTYLPMVMNELKTIFK